MISLGGDAIVTPDNPDNPEKVAAASRWLDETPHDRRGGRALPVLRQRFGLSTLGAIAAIREHSRRLASEVKGDRK